MTPTEVALAYLNSFASGDPNQVADWVTEDFINNQVGEIGARFEGGALYRNRLAGFLAQFLGLNYVDKGVIAQGDMVVVCYEMTATDAGRPITIEGVMIIYVRGDRVARRDDYWDGLTYLRQAGFELPNMRERS